MENLEQFNLRSKICASIIDCQIENCAMKKSIGGGERGVGNGHPVSGDSCGTACKNRIYDEDEKKITKEISFHLLVTAGPFYFDCFSVFCLI